MNTSVACENVYYDEERLAAAAQSGNHREMIGGLWEPMGALQRDFLIARGLLPHHRLLDVGCGCLRAGVEFVRYLDGGHYYGADLSPALLEAGHREIRQLGLAHKLPETNLLCTGEFDFSPFAVPFDFAVAQSVFTHLSLNHLRLCLMRLAPRMRPGGTFFVTFFEVPDEGAMPFSYCHGEVTTWTAKDPFHYFFRDLEYAARGTRWIPAHIGDWGHPRGQRIMHYQIPE